MRTYLGGSRPGRERGARRGAGRGRQAGSERTPRATQRGGPPRTLTTERSEPEAAWRVNETSAPSGEKAGREIASAFQVRRRSSRPSVRTRNTSARQYERP